MARIKCASAEEFTDSSNGLAERHRRLVMDVYEQVLKSLDASRVDEFFRPDYLQHSPLARTGAAGLKSFFKWARSVSASAEHHVERLFVDRDYVIAHAHAILQPGALGSAIVDLFRIQDGRIAEHWHVAQQIVRHSQNDNGMF